jgi:L-serine kinase (ATP) / ParB family transcriptional regulator, heme-responsive regulator
LYQALNGLRLVALDDLILHEAHDARRLARLRERLEWERVQRNPVIVSSHDGGYLVLDGAHRVHASRDVGNALVLVQLTPMPDTPESWAHVVMNPRLERLKDMKHLRVSSSAEGIPTARIEAPGGERLDVFPLDKGLDGEVLALCELQEVYPKDAVVSRLDPHAPVSLGAGEVRILYRSFTPAELVDVVHSGNLLPAGITRFRIRERVLGVRYPLERMRGGDLGARNAELREFVERHWQTNRVRRYDEPVVVFE